MVDGGRGVGSRRIAGTRTERVALWVTVLSAALSTASGALVAQSEHTLTFQQVRAVRVTRTITEFTYRAILTNGGDVLTGATATFTSVSPYTTVVDGAVTFGRIPAGRSIRSRDTFSFRHDRSVPFAWSNLAWTIIPEGLNRPPTITPVASPPPNQNGWNNTPVTVSFSCADPDNDLATCPMPVVLTCQGAKQVAQGTAVDRRGATASTSLTVNIDCTAPVVTATKAPAANGNGWNKEPVIVTFDATDALSGVAPSSVTLPVTFDTDGTHTASGQATDLAGNLGTASLGGINIDRTPPTILVTLSGPPGPGGAYAGPVTALFQCSDALSGIDSCAMEQTIPGPGVDLTVTGTAVDRAGNSASVTSVRFTIILPPGEGPVISSSIDPPPNNGWNNTPVTVTFTCTPRGAPIVEEPPPVVVSTEGKGQVVSGTCRDSLNRNATTEVTLSIDRTPPFFTLSSPASGSPVFVPAPLIKGLPTDALSGVSDGSCNGTPATILQGLFECAPTLLPGANTVAIVVTDRAGNSFKSQDLSLIYRPLPTITLTSPLNLSYLNVSPTTVTGTVDESVTAVTVNSVPAVVAEGQFSLALPISEGPNTITATARTSEGTVGTASVEVTLDTTPPRVTVTSPPADFVTTEATISVAGIVNDIVVGTVNAEQATVTVKGVPAQVANRTFLATDVSLALGANVLEVVGRDRTGNQATTQVTVTRQAAPNEPVIRVVSGNNQSARIGTAVTQPLVIGVTDVAGNAVPGKTVIFKVTANDGLVTASGDPAATVTATTDAQGRAQVQWKLGMRAGAGGNAVEAYSVGISGTALFSATGTLGPAGKIVVDTGNDQIGAIGQPLPKPLIAVVIDDGNNRLGGVPVTLTVSEGGGSFNGEPTLVLTSDPDGRVAATLTLGTQEGNANNLVSATFDGNKGLPAAFSASGRAPGDPAQTTISGVVLDNSNLPIVGATVRAVTNEQLISAPAQVALVPAVQTDAHGQFTITGAPVGFVELLIDGSTAAPTGTYPSLEYELVTVAGQNNTVGLPIYLLPIQTANQLWVSETEGGGTLTIPEAPGFSLTFSPGQVTFPGGSKSGFVSVTVVNREKVPMVPGFGQQPRFIVTIQPAGAGFNPPAAITLPNVDGLAPRSVTEMYSFDHDISAFVAIGTGTVSEDGLIVRSSAGVGVLKAGWHCGGNPEAIGTTADCGVCNLCVKTDAHPEGECKVNTAMIGKTCGDTPTNACYICNEDGKCGVPECNPSKEITKFEKEFGPLSFWSEKTEKRLENAIKLKYFKSAKFLSIDVKLPHVVGGLEKSFVCCSDCDASKPSPDGWPKSEYSIGLSGSVGGSYGVCAGDNCEDKTVIDIPLVVAFRIHAKFEAPSVSLSLEGSFTGSASYVEECPTEVCGSIGGSAALKGAGKAGGAAALEVQKFNNELPGCPDGMSPDKLVNYESCWEKPPVAGISAEAFTELSSDKLLSFEAKSTFPVFGSTCLAAKDVCKVVGLSAKATFGWKFTGSILGYTAAYGATQTYEFEGFPLVSCD